MTTLRDAVTTLCPDRSFVFCAKEVAVLSAVTDRAIRGYLSRLVREQVLVALNYRDGHVVYCGGDSLVAWLSIEPKTKAGGNARAYLAAKDARDSAALKEWREKIQAKTLPKANLLNRAVISRSFYDGLEPTAQAKLVSGSWSIHQ